MNNSTIRNIIKSQSEYLELILAHKKIIEKETLSFKKIASLMDEIKFFWLERIEIINFELENLSKSSNCFLLCGAVYINVKDSEHFYFKSIGDHHFLFDPFLKIENFFRIPENDGLRKHNIDLLKDVLYDTLELLTKYKDYFLIIPAREMCVNNRKKYLSFLKDSYFKFFLGSFNLNLTSLDEFFEKYNTYEKIEEIMPEHVKRLISFSPEDSKEMTLRDKVTTYIEKQSGFEHLIQKQSEAQIFTTILYSFYAQIMDILLLCMTLNIIPYIRFETTFHYLILIMNSFLDDANLKTMIEKTIVFYIFHKSLNISSFKGVDFFEYCSKIENANLLDKIIKEIQKQKIDITKGGVKKVEAIIKDKFRPYLSIE